MYNLNKNGYIMRDEFKAILNLMVGSNITPEQVYGLVVVYAMACIYMQLPTPTPNCLS